MAPFFYFAGDVMAQYDGSIRINTKIDSKEASAQLMTLENRIVKTADKISSLRSKMDALKDAKIPTQEYSEISAQIQKAEAEFNKLLEKQEQMQREGKDNGVAWDRLNAKMDEVGNTIRYAQGELQDLVDTGKAFTLGKDTEEFTKLGRQLQYAENDLGALNRKHDELTSKQSKASKGYKKLGDVAKKSFEKANKSAKKSNGFLSTMASRFKGLALSLLIFNQISKAFNAMISGIKEGMKNLAQYSGETNEALSLLMSRSTQLKNSLATAFSPIMEIAAPALAKLICLLAEASTRISELFSALMGKDTFTKAVQVQQDYAESMDKTSDSISDASKEAKKALAPFDELRQIQFDTEKNDVSADKNELKPSQMFEMVEVSNDAKNLAEGIKKNFQAVKDVFSALFDPLKRAWDKVGPALISSVKGAFSSLAQTAVAVGSSFLKAWNDMGYGERIATNVIRGFANLADTVKILSDRFREAWEEAGVGDRIMQHLLNIVETISEKFLEATEIIKEWAGAIDFTPLLESFDNVLVAIDPIVSDIGDALLWLLENVLLPIAKWGIEQAVPAAFNLIAAALRALHSVIQALKPVALWFWESFLRPFGSWTGQIIIKALTEITKLLIKFSGWINENQGLVRSATITVLAFFAAWKVAELLSFIQQSGSVIKAIKRITEAITVSTLAKAKDIAETAILNAMYAKDFVVSAGKAAAKILGINSNFALLTASIAGIIALIDVLVKNWSKMSPTEKVISGILAAASAVAVLAVALGAIKGALGAALVAGALAAGIASATIAINAGKRAGGSSGYSSNVGRSAFSERSIYPAELSALSYKIPALATGTVVPPNREFLATLGDNKREPEIVSPLSTMKQAFMEALAESGVSGGGQSDRPIYLQLDGKTFARLMGPYTEAEKTRVGVRMVTQGG